VLAGAAGKRRVASREKDKVVQIRASHAQRLALLQSEKASGIQLRLALGTLRSAQDGEDDQFRCAACAFGLF
jgi:hypothetical protein